MTLVVVLLCSTLLLTWLIHLYDRRQWAHERKWLIASAVAKTPADFAVLERKPRKPKPVKAHVDIEETVPIGL